MNNVNRHFHAALMAVRPPVETRRIPFVEIVEPSEREPIDLIPTLGQAEIAEFQRLTLAQGRAAARRRRIAELADASVYRFPDLKVVK